MGFLNRLTIDGNASNVKNYTAGTGINISDNGVISATGVGAIDTSLSTVSTNPVQNRVITNALNGKQEKLVAGTGITIQGSVISSTGGVNIDQSLSTTSPNPVQNKVITNALNGLEQNVTNITQEITDLGDNKQDKLIAGDNITITGNVISATGGGGSVTVDPALSTTSTNPVENRAITTEINSIKTNVATAQNDINDLDTRVQALEDGGECIDYSLDGSYANGVLTLTLSDGTTSQSTNIPIASVATMVAAMIVSAPSGSTSFSFPSIPREKALVIASPYSNAAPIDATALGWTVVLGGTASVPASSASIKCSSGISQFAVVVYSLP